MRPKLLFKDEEYTEENSKCDTLVKLVEDKIDLLILLDMTL